MGLESLENVDLIALLLDEKGNITFCNEYLSKLIGWNRQEVIGKDWFDCFIPKRIYGKIWEIFKKEVETNTYPTHYENEIITRRGEERLISWTNTSLLDLNPSTLT